MCAAAAVVASLIATPGAELISSPVASAGPKPTASVEGATDKDTAWKWFNQKIGGPYLTMDDALRTWSAAMGAGDTDAMHAACGQLLLAAVQFKSILPAPDSRANFRLEGVANDLSTAADRCQLLPPGSNWDTAKDMLTYVDSAKARLKGAKSIMQPNG